MHTHSHSRFLVHTLLLHQSPQQVSPERSRGQARQVRWQRVVGSRRSAEESAPPPLCPGPRHAQERVLSRADGGAPAARLGHGGKTARQHLRLRAEPHLVQQAQGVERDEVLRAEPTQLAGYAYCKLKGTYF